MIFLLMACSGKDSIVDTSDRDDTAPSFAGPCTDGWGQLAVFLDDPESALHVSPEGSPEGDGSVDAPFDRLESALLHVHDNQLSPSIALWPGEYAATAGVLLSATGQGIDDSGGSVVGCGSGQVTLTGGTEAPALDIVQVTDITLAGFTIQGGYRGLVVRGGASIEADGLVIDHATRTGVLIDGSATQATLRDITVRSTVPDVDDSFGWGIAVQDAAVVLENPTVTDMRAVGILVHAGSATLSGGTVSGVTPDAQGLFGRGIQLQALSSGTLSGTQISSVHDAGVFAHRSVELSVDGIWVLDTSAGLTEDGGEASGDGMVVSQADGNNDPADFVVEIHDSIFENSARAGLVLDGVTATLSGVTTPNSGLEQEDTSIFIQGEANVSGGGVPPTTTLSFNLGTLEDPYE